MPEAMQLESDDIRHKVVPSRGPSMYVVGRAAADKLAIELAAEHERGVAVCQDPIDNPLGFRRLYVVPAPKKPKAG